MKSFENYQPSPKETEEAKNKMSETEKKLSEIRNANVEEFKQKMPEKEGVLLKHRTGSTKETVFTEAGMQEVRVSAHRITGVIEGHKIELEANDTKGYEKHFKEGIGFVSCRGTIDGQKLADDDAKKLWDKYYDKSVEKNPEEEELIKRARTEDALKDVI